MDEQDKGPRALTAAPNEPRLRTARSVADAGPGELMFLDRRGEVIGPRRLLVENVARWTLLGGSALATGVVYGALFSSPAAGAVVSAAVAAFICFRLRNWPKLRAAMVLAATSRCEEAHAALLALEGKSLPSGSEGRVKVVLAALEVSLGRPEEALRRLDRIAENLRGSTDGYATQIRWRAASVRAGALVRLGRLDEARRHRDELVAAMVAWEAQHGRTRSEFFDMLVQSVQLAIAFQADAPDELPDNDTLYRWARAALARTWFGELLISLAWAFHRRGDTEMSRHLLAESESRTDRSLLPTTAPRLHAWAEEQRRLGTR